METIIKQLYNNELNLLETQLKSDKTDELRQAKIQAHRALIETFSPKQLELYENYIDCASAYEHDQFTLTFEQGFQLGGKLALEMVGYKQTKDKEEE